MDERRVPAGEPRGRAGSTFFVLTGLTLRAMYRAERGRKVFQSLPALSSYSRRMLRRNRLLNNVRYWSCSMLAAGVPDTVYRSRRLA